MKNREDLKKKYAKYTNRNENHFVVQHDFTSDVLAYYVAMQLSRIYKKKL